MNLSMKVQIKGGEPIQGHNVIQVYHTHTGDIGTKVQINVLLYFQTPRYDLGALFAVNLQHCFSMFTGLKMCNSNLQKADTSTLFDIKKSPF